MQFRLILENWFRRIQSEISPCFLSVVITILTGNTWIKMWRNKFFFFVFLCQALDSSLSSLFLRYCVHCLLLTMHTYCWLVCNQGHTKENTVYYVIALRYFVCISSFKNVFLNVRCKSCFRNHSTLAHDRESIFQRWKRGYPYLL